MNRSIGGFILYIATALYLLAAGAIGLFGKGGEFARMFGVIGISGGLQTALVFIFALAALVAGVLLLLQLFGMEFGIINIILIAVAILWIIFILVFDIIGGLKGGLSWEWLSGLAVHLFILGAIASGTTVFGGN